MVGNGRLPARTVLTAVGPEEFIQRWGAGSAAGKSRASPYWGIVLTWSPRSAG